MKCRALTRARSACSRQAATKDGYCKQHAKTAAGSVPHDASAAERRLRENAAHIVARIRIGSAPIASFGAAGIRPIVARQIFAIADGGEPDITDEGYRAACEQIVQQIRAATAERDGELAAAWREHALGDWRAAKAYLEARSGDEWQPTQQVKLDADVTDARSEDAILDALKALESTGDGSD